MIRRCELTETAARLSLQLEAYRIPDDFEASGEDWQIIARVRDEYTNYKKLASQLPACPDSCPPAKETGVLDGRHCLTYEFAHHILKTEAKQLALHTYNAWRARRRENKAPSLRRDAAAA